MQSRALIQYIAEAGRTGRTKTELAAWYAEHSRPSWIEWLELYVGRGTLGMDLTVEGPRVFVTAIHYGAEENSNVPNS